MAIIYSNKDNNYNLNKENHVRVSYEQILGSCNSNTVRLIV